jgi:predicted nucleic acid-binding protein
MRYVVDTNIFNRIADGKLTRLDLPVGAELVTTHIQENEIRATASEARRAALLAAFELHQDVRVPTESMTWGDAADWGNAKWGTAGFADPIEQALDELNRKKPGNRADSLIAEVAIANDYGLITADQHLAFVARSYMDPEKVLLKP